MRLKSLIIILSAVVSTVLGQQEPIYSQYMFNPTIINPAYAGIYDMVSATAVHRQQYLGVGAGRPSTTTFNAHSSLPLDKMGGGITLVRDKIGINTLTKVELLYSYRLDLGDDRLSFGLSTGFGNYVSDPNGDLIASDADDDFFIKERVSSMKPNFGFGAMYLSDNYFIGISLPSMLNQTVSEGDVATKELRRHIYATGGYIIELANEMKIKPSILIRYVDGTPISFDLNGSILLYQNLWAGLSIRKLNSVVVMGQMQVTDAVKLGASIDFSSNDAIKAVSKGEGVFRFTGVSAFELMANINFAIFDAQAVQTTVY